MSIVLNNEQELAKNELLEFILTPNELKQDSIIVLSGQQVQVKQRYLSLS